MATISLALSYQIDRSDKDMWGNICFFFFLIIPLSILLFICSTTVFGVSTDSMQLSYDHRGNSVPTILLLMQQRLYAQGGLQVIYYFSLRSLFFVNFFLR